MWWLETRMFLRTLDKLTKSGDLKGHNILLFSMILIVIIKLKAVEFVESYDLWLEEVYKKEV